MDPNTRALILGAAGAGGGGPATYVEDVFSTWLYTGNGSTQTITNGIDLAANEGLVWIKNRSAVITHVLTDTARGANNLLYSNAVNAQVNGTWGVNSFSSTGFGVTGSDSANNTNAATYASWTFRKQAKFFDVVTYTGTGVARTISHNLGSVPGCIIVKRTDSPDSWRVYHRSLAASEYLTLSANEAKFTDTTLWNNTAPTSTVFSVGTAVEANANGGTYVAYLFAHDAGGFGDSGNDSIIKCGSYSGVGAVDLGWEPQFLLLKPASTAGTNWLLIDNMRGWSVDDAKSLSPNTSTAEGSAGAIRLTSTGFNDQSLGYSNTIYIAIRRGPMKTPTDATKVFQAKLYTGTNVDNRLVTTDIVTDMAWVRQRNDGVLAGMVAGDRMRGQPYLLTGTTAGEVNDADSFDQQLVSAVEYGTAFSSMTGFWVGNDPTSKLNADTSSNNHLAYAFRRAPGFFDVVAYAGTGVARTISHNLGVTPEMIILKQRSGASGWAVYHKDNPITQVVELNLSNALVTTDRFNSTAPTSSVFSVSDNGEVNGSAQTYIAYLFASCPGVSKVGSYTGLGVGNTINIDCGFTNGARFVLIKRTGGLGNWFVWDATRGIVSGNDPYLTLNTPAASEVTNTDYIDPLSSGFQISTTAPAAMNANGDGYIYLAIA